MRKLFSLAFGWLLAATVYGQSTPTTGSVRTELEVGGMGPAVGQLPFWLRANQNGIVPLEGPFGTLRGSLMRDYKPDTTRFRKRRFDWGAGIYAAANLGKTSQFLLPEYYAKVRYGQIELWAGRRREVYGIGDTTLTSGFVIWSGNALPIPKVQLQTAGFVPIGGFVKKLVAVQAGYAHGWFNAPYIQNAFLHQKYLYGRFGKPHWPVKVYAGINHQVQWGGHADYLRGSPFAANGKLPSSFNDYVSLLLARYPKDLVNNQQTAFDGENRVGNHIGSIDYAVEWTHSRANFLLYYQHLYEDASGVVFLNFPDGLWGIRYRNRTLSNSRFRLNGAVLEWLPTTNQSGPVFDQTAQYQGGDNYFNHGQYREGWSYFSRTIGTPFIAPRADFTARVREYIGGGFFPNNRVNVWHLGLDGTLYQVRLNARASLSRNYGTFNEPYSPPFRQFSGLLSAQFALPRISNTVLTASSAIDQGDLYPRQTSFFLSVKKTW
ncbi:capsule assembly Wzi family protein [Larkinella harenae]